MRVGTVDRFQGLEAVIAIVTLAASSPEDVPRGLEFLLMRNRLNVGISRAQWAAHLVSSDRLGDGLPSSAEGLAALSGYLRLIERAAEPGPEFTAVSGRTLSA
ncbi:AAA domain-containing protein [Leucobacter luti]|uniref:AAA domain-containing protein n=1 Tax=Leucobacter luti TaxID=340320 RepID=UPI0028682B04|nr:AAA domain-containing protein [Leucobacter luti]